MSDSPWLYNDTVFTEDMIEDYVGFVYLITDLETDRLYIGKKIFFNKVSKPPLKGKKRRRISKKFSNWQEYFGSNDELALLAENSEKSRFKREILRLCRSKSEMSYYETKLIFERDAIINERYFNSWVSTRINRSQLRSMITGD